MKKSLKLFTTVMVCMAIALCVSCKSNNSICVTSYHKYVDLGLPSGLMWATENVGGYFAWGETKTKDAYLLRNYSHVGRLKEKYSNISKNGKLILDPEDDAAHMNWGGGWRMPTEDEMEELKRYCTWEWTTQDKKNGCLVTGPNGNSIFLPAAGYYDGDDGSFSYPDGTFVPNTRCRLYGKLGEYWSKSLTRDHGPYSGGAYCLTFDHYSDKMGLNVNVSTQSGQMGRSVRAVYNPQSVSVPIVITSSISNITHDAAIGGGEVTSEGGDIARSPGSAAVTARGVCWSTSPNPTISNSHTTVGTGIGAFSSSITGLTANTVYYVRAYATNSKGTSYGEQQSFTTLGSKGGGTGNHEYVDLGLPSGLLWATCNVGADSPEDYGNYYAWGETSTKSTYDWRHYKLGRDSSKKEKLKKYNQSSYRGIVDNKTVLEPEDDAAHVNWGGWRMPTEAELQELQDRCTWTWTTLGGKNGYRVTGPNGNSIFLPAAGCYIDGSLGNAGSAGSYLSSSLSYSYSTQAYYLNFTSNRVYMNDTNRCYGGLIRPVRQPQN